MRVVLDTNVLAAALTTSGTSKDVFEFAISHDQVCLSNYILREVQKVLLKKFRLPAPEVAQAISFLKDFATIVTADLPADNIPQVKDKTDWPILWFARVMKADALITGDSELLYLKKFGKVKIIEPAQYFRRRAE